MRLTSLTPGNCTLATEAAIWLIYASVLVKLKKFKAIAPSIGTAMCEHLSDEENKKAKAIALAIARANRYLPWHSRCLIQAVAAARMLKRRGLAYSFYLGVGKDNKQQLCAHAWTRSGTVYVNGGNIRHDYEVVGVYSFIPH